MGLRLNRLPFTIVMLAALVIGALATNSHVADLSTTWLRHLGYAPRDLLRFDWMRLMTSALVTTGGAVFWLALGLTAFCVGAAEWLAGTRRAALTFWGVHFGALVLESLFVAVPLRLLGLTLGSLLVVVRDVGPSAGYMGCLGLAIARWRSPWRRLAALAIGVLLVLAFLLPPPAGREGVRQFSANLFHLIAFPLGWISSYASARHGRAPAAAAQPAGDVETSGASGAQE